MAIALAAMGVFAVTSQHVAQRRREIGLRMAIGALPSEVVGMVLRDAGRLSFLGLLFGVGGAWLSARLLRGFLHGVSPFDPIVLGAAVLTVAVLTVAACGAPALRAARIDPMSTLRME